MSIGLKVVTQFAPQSELAGRKLSPFIGSEVVGLDLKQKLDPKTVAAIRALVLERGMVVFRDQHLSPQQQIDFAALFGQVQIPERPRPSAPLPGVSLFDSRDQIYGRVSRWHADLTSAEIPGSFRVLQAVEIPEVGGDTQWASAQAAYDRLPPELQRLAETLTAVHALTPIKVAEWGKSNLAFHWAEHPVVTVHPETGRKVLFVNPRYTAEIAGYRPHLSAAVLKLFFDHLLQPEFTVRHRWTKGAVVIWDNRSTLHYAIDDYDDALRVMHTVSVIGERPVGVAPQ